MNLDVQLGTSSGAAELGSEVPYIGAMSSRRDSKPRSWVEELPILRRMTREEFNELFADAEPPTEDDVPWRFPVRTPVKRAADSDED